MNVQFYVLSLIKCSSLKKCLAYLIFKQLLQPLLSFINTSGNFKLARAMACLLLNVVFYQDITSESSQWHG